MEFTNTIKRIMTMNEKRAAQSQRGENSEIRDDTPNLHTNIVDYWKKLKLKILSCDFRIKFCVTIANLINLQKQQSNY